MIGLRDCLHRLVSQIGAQDVNRFGRGNFGTKGIWVGVEHMLAI